MSSLFWRTTLLMHCCLPALTCSPPSPPVPPPRLPPQQPVRPAQPPSWTQRSYRPWVRHSRGPVVRDASLLIRAALEVGMTPARIAGTDPSFRGGRTSTTASLSWFLLSRWLWGGNETLSALARGVLEANEALSAGIGTDPVFSEQGLSFTWYSPGSSRSDSQDTRGGSYVLHHDVTARWAPCDRWQTVLVYLNDVEDGRGGGTIFPFARGQGVSTAEAIRASAASFKGGSGDKRRELQQWCEAGREGDRSGAEAGAEAGAGVRDEARRRGEGEAEESEQVEEAEEAEEAEPSAPPPAIYIQPKRGSAILFRSRLPSGEMDPFAIHGGCPVVGAAAAVGAQEEGKWILQQFYSSCPVSPEWDPSLVAVWPHGIIDHRVTEGVLPGLTTKGNVAGKGRRIMEGGLSEALSRHVRRSGGLSISMWVQAPAVVGGPVNTRYTDENDSSSDDDAEDDSLADLLVVRIDVPFRATVGVKYSRRGVLSVSLPPPQQQQQRQQRTQSSSSSSEDTEEEAEMEASSVDVVLPMQQGGQGEHQHQNTESSGRQAAAALEPGQWYHIAIVVDGERQTKRTPRGEDAWMLRCSVNVHGMHRGTFAGGVLDQRDAVVTASVPLPRRATGSASRGSVCLEGGHRQRFGASINEGGEVATRMNTKTCDAGLGENRDPPALAAASRRAFALPRTQFVELYGRGLDGVEVQQLGQLYTNGEEGRMGEMAFFNPPPLRMATATRAARENTKKKKRTKKEKKTKKKKKEKKEKKKKKEKKMTPPSTPRPLSPLSPRPGVDASFPMHRNIADPTGYAAKRYSAFMSGCIAARSADVCERAEFLRMKMNREQVPRLRNFTELGFGTVKTPGEVQRRLAELWASGGGDEAKVEEWSGVGGFTVLNHWKVPTRVVPIDDDKELQKFIYREVGAQAEQWAGVKLRPVSMYGLRVYGNGAILAPHVDTMPRVISAILQVAQDVDEDWMTEFIAHDGVAHNVSLAAGDCAMYESHTVIHGRPAPLRGRYFANLFVHFVPEVLV